MDTGRGPPLRTYLGGSGGPGTAPRGHCLYIAVDAQVRLVTVDLPPLISPTTPRAFQMFFPRQSKLGYAVCSGNAFMSKAETLRW